MQKVVHGKAPQYLKDLMIPSERLRVHENKQLLPRTRTDIFKTSFSFSGSLAWNSLAHHLRYPMESKGKHFRHSLSHLDTSLYFFFFRFFSRSPDNTKCIEFCFPFLALVKFYIFISWKTYFLYLYFHEIFTLFLYPRGHHFYYIHFFFNLNFVIIICLWVCVVCFDFG